MTAARLSGASAHLGRVQLRQRRVVDLALALLGIGFGATIGLAVTAESSGALAAPGGVEIAIGRFAGLAGTYLLLVMVLLMARLPIVERAVGQDRLARWHRRIAPWPVALIVAHVVFIVLGYAASARSGVLEQIWVFLTAYPDVLAAAVGFVLLLLVSVASIRAIRRRLRYETWWAIHLYIYLALALSFAHQIATGASFVGHPLARWIWGVVWASTAGMVIAFRVLVPLGRSLRHRLRVVHVREDSPGVFTVICAGHHVDRLGVRGGQFFQWRFLTPSLWWQAHPYSISALPRPPYLRVTVRARGDHSGTLAQLRPGTWVAIEGPYGAFTADRRHGNGVLLVGAGVGVTPLRAILEELPPDVDAEVLVRASTRSDLVLEDELRALVEARGARLHEVVGSRKEVRVDADLVGRLVPDVAGRDVFVCGPDGFSDALVAAVRKLGVPNEHIHREEFAF